MTTPERFRRRQLTEGIVLLLLAIFTVAQGIYWNVQDDQQTNCFESNFVELSKALGVRGELAQRESAANRAVLLSFSRAAAQAGKKLSAHQQERQRQDLVDVLVNYKTEMDRIQKEREDNPVPPYPAGSCEE